MKGKKSASYFPVDEVEQAILLRIREPDLADRAADVVEMLDLIAEAKMAPADLEQALHLLDDSRQSEGLDARFENLEARLAARIDQGLAEIEGRLSQRLGGGAPQPAVRAVPPPPPPPPTRTASVPKDANLAFRIENDIVWGPSASQFYVKVWKWLFEHRRVALSDLPITGGKQRHVVAAKPVHPSGKDFYRAEEAVPGAFVEVNLSRPDIVRRAKKHLAQYGVRYEVLVGSDD